MSDLVSRQPAIRGVLQQRDGFASMLPRNFLRARSWLLNVLEHDRPVANGLILDPLAQGNDSGVFGGASATYNDHAEE
jgi:hypothetical protein